MKIPCRLCTSFEAENESLKDKLAIYVNQLKEDERADDILYAKRIQVCDTCDANRQGLCGFCGCFVIVRAAKKQTYCPHPCGRQW